MNKLYKYFCTFLFSFFFCSLFLFPVSAEQDSTYPDFVTSDQKQTLYSYLGNPSSFSDLVVYFDDSIQKLYVSQSVSDFDFNSGSLILSKIVSIESDGTIVSVSGSLSVSDFRSSLLQFFYMKVDSNYYFGPSYYAPFSSGFILNVTQFVSDVSYDYESQTYPTDFSMSLNSGSFEFSGDLACGGTANGYCSIWSSDAGGVSGAITEPLKFSVDSPLYIDGNLVLGSSTSSLYNYTVTTVFEFLFDNYYSGYFSGDFQGFTSDNAIVNYDRLYFTNVSKITLSDTQYYRGSDVVIPPFDFAITGYNFELSDGFLVSDKTSHGLLSNIYTRLNSGINEITSLFRLGPTDTHKVNTLNNNNSLLTSSSNSLSTYEKNFNSDLTSSLSNINISSGDLTTTNDFVSTSNFIKLQFDTLLDYSGIYKQAITFSLIIGLALLLIGRRS